LDRALSCQLLDDYPLFSVDDKGMAMRQELIRYYQQLLVSRIAGVSGEISKDDPWSVVVACTVYRVAFGLAKKLH
jgi:hypothetical protein